MTEEQVTKNIMSWLIDKKWTIVCFDFPQSGTGLFLHPNNTKDKNKDSINPDIVAVKNKTCLFFENKNRFFLDDYKKINKLITTDDYSDDIQKLLCDYKVENIYYGIGMTIDAYEDSIIKYNELVNFVIGTNEMGEVEWLYRPMLVL